MEIYIQKTEWTKQKEILWAKRHYKAGLWSITGMHTWTYPINYTINTLVQASGKKKKHTHIEGRGIATCNRCWPRWDEKYQKNIWYKFQIPKVFQEQQQSSFFNNKNGRLTWIWNDWHLWRCFELSTWKLMWCHTPFLWCHTPSIYLFVNVKIYKYIVHFIK